MYRTEKMLHIKIINGANEFWLIGRLLAVIVLINIYSLYKKV